MGVGGPGCDVAAIELGLACSCLFVTNRNGFGGTRKLCGKGGAKDDRDVSVELNGRVHSTPLLKLEVCGLVEVNNCE